MRTKLSCKFDKGEHKLQHLLSHRQDHETYIH